MTADYNILCINCIRTLDKINECLPYDDKRGGRICRGCGYREIEFFSCDWEDIIEVRMRLDKP